MRAAAIGAVILAVALAGCGSGSSSGGAGAGGSAGTTTTAEAGTGKGATPATSGSKGVADGSIQGYGAAATGAEKAAVLAAVHGFLTAMARRNYAGMCAHLTGANRQQLEAFGQRGGGPGGCAGALRAVLSPAVAGEARAAAAAPVESVRIEGGNAFAIFTPRGGSASYLAVKREGGGWKAISVTPGTPLEPSSNP